MSNNINLYKLYQLMEYFVSKYNYQPILLKPLNKKDEIWLINFNHPKYQVVRLSLDDTYNLYTDTERKKQILISLSNRFMHNCELLDILIGKNDNDKGYDLNKEEFNTIILDENYYYGIDLNNYYSNLDKIIHQVSSPNEEIYRCINIINKKSSSNKSKGNRMSLLGNNSKATTFIIILCIISFILSFLLSIKYSAFSAYVFFGADYKTFTLGLKQYYRLITVAFSHGGIIHLLMNMMSLSIVGSYIDKKYGTKFYLITLFLSIFCGSLTHGILRDNTLSVGISGGIYGLMVIYLIDAIKMGSYRYQSFLNVIFVNVLINLMSNVAWQAHLGGAICGLIMYLIINSEYKEIAKALLLITILSLSYKYLTIDTIKPFYPNLDKQITNIYYDLGLKNYANNLEERLSNLYNKYK